MCALILRSLSGVGEHIAHEGESLWGNGHLAKADAESVCERVHLEQFVA